MIEALSKLPRVRAPASSLLSAVTQQAWGSHSAAATSPRESGLHAPSRLAESSAVVAASETAASPLDQDPASTVLSAVTLQTASTLFSAVTLQVWGPQSAPAESPGESGQHSANGLAASNAVVATSATAAAPLAQVPAYTPWSAVMLHALGSHSAAAAPRGASGQHTAIGLATPSAVVAASATAAAPLDRVPASTLLSVVMLQAWGLHSAAAEPPGESGQQAGAGLAASSAHCFFSMVEAPRALSRVGPWCAVSFGNSEQYFRGDASMQAVRELRSPTMTASAE
mmetsp:Transcript_160062/g.513527  ORF Transcript_160062/g.513527 Transcript_160062/m.513527 type:complete len:284 (+) Transcript_160062:368-1219(+)